MISVSHSCMASCEGAVPEQTDAAGRIRVAVRHDGLAEQGLMIGPPPSAPIAEFPRRRSGSRGPPESRPSILH